MMSWCHGVDVYTLLSSLSSALSREVPGWRANFVLKNLKGHRDIGLKPWSREALTGLELLDVGFWESQQADSSGMYDEASNSGSFLPCDATMLYPNLSCFLDLKCDNETSEKGYGKYFACHVARNLAKGTSVVRFPWPSKICNRTIATQRGAGTDSSGIHILCKNYTKLLTRLTICS